MKKVMIIGGGIAGLSAGVYAQKCGFDTTILEGHHQAGGNCTAWKRGDYLFEGGIHWLAGTNPQDPLNQRWRFIGALNDDVVIHGGEPFLEYRHEGIPIYLYRDVQRTEEHLLALSPGDETVIKELCDNIRKVQRDEAVDPSYCEVSREDYASRFSHPGIRELIRAVAGDQQGILMLLFTMGALANGDGGFPEGGSLPFVKRIVKRFTDLGGTILYNTHVDQVLVEAGRATGVIAGGEQIAADAVIVTADTMVADQLFDQPLQAPWLTQMRAVAGPTMATLVSLGIRTDLRSYPERFLFKLKTPITLAAQTYQYLSVNNYAADPNYSPAGKTAMTIQLTGNTYEFWKTAKAEGRYTEEKQRIGRLVSTAVTAQISQAEDQIEVIDVATPLTYERYCGNWQGSWMTEMRSDLAMEPYPPVIAGLNQVYFAGQRMMPPGGLPPAMLTGRTAVEQLCRDFAVPFCPEEEGAE